jgi:hypothetical protein
VILDQEGGEKLTSDTINIVVEGERILINPNIPRAKSPANVGGAVLLPLAKQDLSKIQL